MIKQISFDFWGTLFKGNPQYKIERNKIIKEILFPEQDIDDETIKSVKQYCDFSNEVLGDQLNREQSLLLITKTMDIDRIEFSKRLEVYSKVDEKLIETYPPLIKDPYTKQLFSFCEEMDFKLNLLSNTSFIPGRLLRKVINIHPEIKFHETLFSDEMGMSKPNPKVFMEVIDLWGYKPNEILHVGDNLNIDGACCKEGIKFYWVGEKEGEGFENLIEQIKILNGN